jgi:hypothetical protein
MTRSTKSLDELFHEVISNVVLWAVLACWMLEAGMNATFGYKIAGYGLSVIFVAVAVLGAYLAVKVFAVRGKDLRAWGRRAMFGVPLALCFSLCQAAGWSTLGTMLADGMTARETLATSRSSAADKLRLARDERAKLGAPRPIGTIKAELELEKTRKSAAYPDGRGPKALALEAELAAAERAAELDELIPNLVAELEGREQVAEGTPHLDVMVRLTGAKPDEVAFWWPVVLTAVIGFFATFGWPLAGVGRGGHELRQPEPDPLADFDWGPRRLPPPSGYHQNQGFGEAGTAGASPSAQRVSSRQTADAGSPGHASFPSGGPAAAHVHGAPINISVALPAAGVGGGLEPGASPSPAAERIATEPKAMLPAPGAGAALRARVLETPPAAQRPVDRRHVQELIDHLLCFRAACVLDAAGGVVPAREMYERYVSWAGERAISEQAFDTMFGELAGIARVNFGGVPHYRGVVLNREPRLSAVGE